MMIQHKCIGTISRKLKQDRGRSFPETSKVTFFIIIQEKGGGARDAHNVASATTWNGKLLADGYEMAVVALLLIVYSRKDGKKSEREETEGRKNGRGKE